MKNVSSFNVLNTTELGGFTQVTMTACNMSDVISDAFFMVSYLILPSIQRGDYFSEKTVVREICLRSHT